MQEMVSMGIGSKPFMDIKPSDAAISDRAIDYIMKGTGELLFHYSFSLRKVCLFLLPVPRIPWCLLLVPRNALGWFYPQIHNSHTTQLTCFP